MYISQFFTAEQQHPSADRCVFVMVHNDDGDKVKRELKQMNVHSVQYEDPVAD